MKNELEQIRKALEEAAPGNRCQAVSLFPGIRLYDLTVGPGSLPLRHEPLADMVQLDHCRAGQAVWRTGDGHQICLGPGDLSLHTMAACAGSLVTFPAGGYSGLAICIDLPTVSASPPELLRELDGFPGMLEEKFCRDGAVSLLAGNEETEKIFSGFYGQPERLRLPYQRVKALELFLYLAKLELTEEKRLAAFRPEQVEIVRRIHDRLLENLDQRVTIEELSRQYLINPTTLKEVFKTVYGTSIATHIKTHRMELAAKLLRSSDRSIAEIAQAVGYDSQSRFTAAFKSVFRVLPKEYRRMP